MSRGLMGGNPLMAGKVKEAEAALCQAAIRFKMDDDESKAELLSRAWRYGTAKSRAANARDKWKRKKRLGQ